MYFEYIGGYKDWFLNGIKYTEKTEKNEKEYRMRKDEKLDKDGQLHCDNGPAVVFDYDGGEEIQYYNHGKKHRVGGPAIDGPNSTEYWIEGRLHRDGGPSVTYHKGNGDGLGVNQCLYHLNGVIVSKEIAESTHSDFKRELFYKEKNVEVKREIIRKFGIERIIKVVDEKEERKLKEGDAILLDESKCDNEYCLYRIRLTKETFGTYLKMKNPSIGVFHMECVPHDVMTIHDALSFRNHGFTGSPEILT